MGNGVRDQFLGAFFSEADRLSEEPEKEESNYGENT